MRQRWITPLEALHEAGCMRLAARVHELRTRGVDVQRQTVQTENGKSVAAYRIAE